MGRIAEGEAFVVVKREIPAPRTDEQGQTHFLPRRVFLCRMCDGRGWYWVGSAFDPDEPTQEPCEPCDTTGEVLEGTRAGANLMSKARAYRQYHTQEQTYGCSPVTGGAHG